MPIKLVDNVFRLICINNHDDQEMIQVQINKINGLRSYVCNTCGYVEQYLTELSLLYIKQEKEPSNA